MKFRILFILWSALILWGCNNSTEPGKLNVDNTLRVILSADKTSGTAPLTVKFAGRIQGDTSSFVGHVPDYSLGSPSSFTSVVRIIPDTTQPIRIWNSEKKLMHPGEYKFFLEYLGIKNGMNLTLFSDTLTIKVN